METLVWLRVGDIRAARRCLSRALRATQPLEKVQLIERRAASPHATRGL